MKRIFLPGQVPKSLQIAVLLGQADRAICERILAVRCLVCGKASHVLMKDTCDSEVWRAKCRWHAKRENNVDNDLVAAWFVKEDEAEDTLELTRVDSNHWLNREIKVPRRQVSFEEMRNRVRKKWGLD